MSRCKLPDYMPNWRCRRHNTVPLSLIRSTVTASVVAQRGEWGAGSALSKSAHAYSLYLLFNNAVSHNNIQVSL